jgi:hypothetical protein
VQGVNLRNEPLHVGNDDGATGQKDKLGVRNRIFVPARSYDRERAKPVPFKPLANQFHIHAGSIVPAKGAVKPRPAA